MKLEAKFGDGSATEIEVARIEREAWAAPATLVLSLSEGKRLTAAIQTEMVRAQASIMGERFRCCAHCGSALCVFSRAIRPRLARLIWQMTIRLLIGYSRMNRAISE
jgi:hypothetical protein